MTADAKIGLLLGLVFIVIIAFLVNGLPNFFRRDRAAAGIDTSVVAPPQPNILIETTLNNSMMPPRDRPAPRQSEPPKGKVEIEVAHIVPDAARQKPPTSSKPNRKVKTYKVSDGDSLTAIAKKVYGPDFGAKQSTINAIAMANKLDSPDLIVLGQDLLMPRLTSTTPKTMEKPLIAVRTVVNKAKTFFTRKTKRASTVKYVVKSGDCLSEISAKQLGTCKRVDEIKKLNGIDDADDIAEGMVLRLPQS